MVIACALLAAVYFYNRVDQEIRTVVEKKLAAFYPGLNVSVDSARLIERRGFEIRGVTIAERQGKQCNNIAFFDEIFVQCEPTLRGLLEGDINVRQVTIRRPLVRAIHNMNGFEGVQRLLDVASTVGQLLPEIRIENGTVEVTDAMRVSTGLFAIRDINLRMVANVEAMRSSRGSGSI